MKKIIIIILAVYFGQLDAQHSKASAAYASQDYETAIAAWTKELTVKNSDKNAIYSYLGNSYVKLQNYSAAIAQYEKALRENYNQSDVKFNIKVCRAKLNLDTENKVLFTTDWVQKIAYLVPIQALKWLLIVVGCLALIVSGYLYFFSQVFLEKARPFVLTMGAILAILFILQSYFISTQGFAVISQNTVGYENSSFKGKSKAINEGEKVEVLDEIGQNIEIKTEANLSFWIDKSVILPI